MLYYLLLAEMKRLGDNLQRQNIWVIQHPASMLKVKLDAAIVILRLLLDRDFSRVVDGEFPSDDGKEAELHGEEELNVFILASINEFCRSVTEVL